MPQTKNRRFPLAEFMKRRKEIRQNIVNQNRRLACEQKKIERLEEKFEKAKQRKENILQDLQNVGNIPEDSRTVKPTSLENNESTMSRSTASVRREKTFSAALKIHGGSVSKPKPAYDGLVDTMNKKFTIKHFKEYFGNHRVVKEHVLPKVYEKQLREFEKSAANVIRSISVFYSGGVLGKRKYQAIRVAESMQSNPSGRKTALCVMKGCKLPKLLTYNNLRNEINKIDIGDVYSLDEGELAFMDDSTDSVSGCYRDLRQYLPRLAKFYLSLNDTRKDKLKWFSENENTFLVALGGDSCPFGKHESACSFLVSFINVGHRVASSDENYLVFGGNCDEGHIVIKKYVQMLVKQMSDLDGKKVSYDEIDMVFKFEEFPNDMKMLCTLAGEISNAATYFSTFANVCKGNASDVTGTFGKKPSDTWKPFTYRERCQVSQKISKFKEELSNSCLAESTARSKVTAYIGTLKSRQEFEPLIGEFVDKLHIEPLHMKNNAWQQWQKGLLKLAISKSNIPPACSSFKDVNPESPFARYVNTIQYEVKAKCLARKIKKWFNETKGNGKELEYRLTGKDSRLLCHNFMLLIKCVSVDGDSSKGRFSVLVYAFIGLKLRNCVSIFSRLEIDPEQIKALEENAQAYFRANAMFVPKAVTPTVWSMGHIIPAHTKFFYEKYSQGLLTNTMEGREAKHIVLMRLSQNTTYQNRWKEIFRHEFVKLIWLREQEGYSSGEPASTRNIYIPPNVNKESHCYCGFQKAATDDPACCFCGDDLMKELELCTKQGKITKKMNTILSSR